MDPYFEGFLPPVRSILNPMFTLCAMYLVYGFYVILFSFYMRILHRRQKLHGPTNCYRGSTITLFILSTFLVFIQTVYRVRQAYVKMVALVTDDYDPLFAYLNYDTLKTFCYASSDTLEILLNSVADYMLIHRCYVIWDSRKRVAYPLAVASILTNLAGIAGTIVFAWSISDTTDPLKAYIAPKADTVESASMYSSIIVNASITFVTASRIWCIYRQSRRIGSSRLFRSVASIIVESGMLYPAITLFQVIMGNTLPDRITPIDLAPTCYIVAGLAPTLIMVRAQQGKTVEETIHAEQTLTGVRFASAPAPSESGETTTMAETGSGFTTSTLRSGQGERV